MHQDKHKLQMDAAVTGKAQVRKLSDGWNVAVLRFAPMPLVQPCSSWRMAMLEANRAAKRGET